MESTPSTELADLVRRAQKGDERAQHELIVAYQHRVAGFVYAMTNRSDYVEDLAQQVFIKMIRALDRLQAPAQFESWLFRLARNTCIDQLRRQKLRRIFLPFGDEHENIPEPPGAVPISACSHWDPLAYFAKKRTLGAVKPTRWAVIAWSERLRTVRLPGSTWMS